MKEQESAARDTSDAEPRKFHADSETLSKLSILLAILALESANIGVPATAGTRTDNGPIQTLETTAVDRALSAKAQKHARGRVHRSKHSTTKLRSKAPALPKLSRADQLLLNEIQRAHFQYFKEQSDPVTGLAKDRSTKKSPSSIAAIGFSLTAYGVAAERKWITRAEAIEYTTKVLNTLWCSPQGDEPDGRSGTHGFFYHFLNPSDCTRAFRSEISTIDTALLMAGVLFAKNYFSGTNDDESRIRDLCDKLYLRVDWTWALRQDNRMHMAWTPKRGFQKAVWRGYDEAPILLLLGMGSPTHPLPADVWHTYMATDKIGELYGLKQIEFGPLFGHQYPQVWIDFRGTMDASNRKLGFDYFENARRAVLVQHKYAIDNPQKWTGYSALDWGLTACDGPGRVSRKIDGKKTWFRRYSARGYPHAFDDGTIAPTAAASSLPFAPEIVLPTLRHWMKERPELFGPLGFADAFNPTFDKSKPSGWIDKDRLGINQGPILLMIENYRHGTVWRTMNRDQYVNAALHKAGFTAR